MKSKEILEKYIKFFEERGHVLIPNVSLVPENDPTLLYVNSGMFPLVPYLSGQEHPQGKRLVNVQRCLRFFEDLENIGITNRHTTAFHMLGNWSLGDYFKQEQLPWAYEFLIEVLGLDPQKMYASVFEGDRDAPRDEEAIKIIKEIFAKYGIEAKVGERIFLYGKSDNWWQRGEAIGELGGPDSELFYYIGKDGNGLGQNPAENQDDFLELGNNVFMQYRRSEKGWEELPQKNVDFGGGLERMALFSQIKQDIYQTDNFWPIIQKIEEISGKTYGEDPVSKKNMCIIADHMRASVFLAMDGVIPTNKDQGYILRRLIRRMVRAGKVLGLPADSQISVNLVEVVCKMFTWIYPDLAEKREGITQIFAQEEAKFRKVLETGARQVDKYLDSFDGSEQGLAKAGFDFYQSLGYPFEIFVEDVKDKFGSKIDAEKLSEEFLALESAHKQESRQGAEQKFKGGLADHEEQTVNYHTTTHLVHWALREVLGNKVHQKGSNITGERLRFDFSFDRLLSENELEEVTDLVNSKIGQDIPVNFETLPKAEAIKTGALHFFGDTYGDQVKVYYIGESLDSAISKEFCGGPHVKNLTELDPIEIYQQKSLGENVARVYLRKKA